MLKSLGKNYLPVSMSFADGYRGAKGDVGYVMRFSLRKAKAFVRGKEAGIHRVVAGLDGDFTVNSAVIFEGGEWIKPGKWRRLKRFYRRSTWATPIILIEYEDRTTEAFECWSREEYSYEEQLSRFFRRGREKLKDARKKLRGTVKIGGHRYLRSEVEQKIKDLKPID